MFLFKVQYHAIFLKKRWIMNYFRKRSAGSADRLVKRKREKHAWLSLFNIPPNFLPDSTLLHDVQVPGGCQTSPKNGRGGAAR
jgi:hypothetical protein